jgi:hypothetical protein
MIVVAVRFPSGEVAESQICSLHGLQLATIPRDWSNPELLAALRDGQVRIYRTWEFILAGLLTKSSEASLFDKQ